MAESHARTRPHIVRPELEAQIMFGLDKQQLISQPYSIGIVHEQTQSDLYRSELCINADMPMLIGARKVTEHQANALETYMRGWSRAIIEIDKLGRDAFGIPIRDANMPDATDRFLDFRNGSPEGFQAELDAAQRLENGEAIISEIQSELELLEGASKQEGASKLLYLPPTTYTVACWMVDLAQAEGSGAQ